MRIAVLCNDRLAIPALQQVAQSGLLKAVGTSDRSPEMIAIMKQVSTQARVPSSVFTRKNFEAELHAWLDKSKPDVVLVKTFPFLIPASALAVPKFGFINFHYAPLPEFSGSNPLFWMIRNGITNGGVTVHRMNADFDSGPILLQQAVNFSPDATFGICSTQLAITGAQLTGLVLNGLIQGNLKETTQLNENRKWYGRPKPSDFIINWKNQNADEIKCLVKACNPWMKGAPSLFKGWPLGVSDASVSTIKVPEGTVPGTIIALSAQTGMIIACANETALKAEVIYAEEGFFAGDRASYFGIKVGDSFS